MFFKKKQPEVQTITVNKTEPTKQLIVYKNQIRDLNQAIQRRNYTIDKLKRQITELKSNGATSISEKVNEKKKVMKKSASVGKSELQNVN